MSVFHEFDDVDKFTVGTVGRPGERTFFLQIRADGSRIAIKCEKQQAAAISQYLTKVLSDLPPAEDRPIPGAMELSALVDPVFVLGPIGLGYDRSNDKVLLQLEEGPAPSTRTAKSSRTTTVGTFGSTSHRGQADAFVKHAAHVIESGRPECTWCGNPIDPDGHVCPRMN